MKILFACNSIGLGHATRSMPLIQALVEKKHEVHILSHFRGLAYLKEYFKTKIKGYYDVPDYSIEKIFNKEKFSVLNMMIKTPTLISDFNREHKEFMKLQRKEAFDKVVTDSRYGIYCPDADCFLLAHHIKFSLDFNPYITERFTEGFYYTMQNRFKNLLIPDFEEDGGVGGGLCHDFRYLSKEKIKYLGITSMIKKMDIKEDIDYFISISGPEPQRTIFEKKIMQGVHRLNGKVVITLGRPEVTEVKHRGNITIYGCFNPKKQQEYMNRAKMIISRSGYTTLMELAELGKNALLVPTKGQPEQEYLSKYLMDKGIWYSVDQDKLNLDKDIPKAEKYTGYNKPYSTCESVRRFIKIIGA
jgi:UDP-N-acetylglucosamine transferase subunit ALG13